MSETNRTQVTTGVDGLRDRIAAVLIAHPDLISGKCHGIEEPELQFDHQDKWAEHVADAVIAELDDVLVDWGLWLAEEITGRTMTRLDMESCLTDWKADDE